MSAPARLPDAASVETVLAVLDPALADADLLPALTAAFPGFELGVARIGDDYWLDTRSVTRPNGSRLGELRPWMMDELAKENGDVKALWQLMTPETSVHLLMDRIEAIDREIALPFSCFFLMTHGQWVEADVGLAIAQGRKAQRVRLPDPDADVLPLWAERTYGF